MDQYVVLIENFPSRTEVYELVDNYLKENGYPSNYKSRNKDNLITFYFFEENAALGLVKWFNIEKIKNKIYHNLICKFTIEKRKPFHLHTKSSVQLSHRLQTISTLSSTSKKKNKTILTTSYDKKDNTYNHIHLLDITSKAGVINTSSPYLTEEEKYKNYMKESGKKNISKNKFQLYFGKATSNKAEMIKNYVNLTPCTENAINHKFREVNKNKWIGKKNFLVV